MKITRETQVDIELEDKFWLLYKTAFAELRTASPCRQYMYESEFREEMSDERMLKFVLWKKDVAVAMALVAVDMFITSHLSTAIRYSISSVLFLGYIAMAYILEKPKKIIP